MKRHRVLVIGNAESALRTALVLLAEVTGWEAEFTGSVSGGLTRLADDNWSLVVLVVDRGEEELELIRRLVKEMGPCRLVVATRSATPRFSMEVIRAGAAELLTPPYATTALAGLLKGEESGGNGEGEGIPLRESDDELIGGSAGLLEVFKTIGRVGPTDATVLVTGESGTGKELVAAALHRISRRSSGPFIAVNCAAIPEDLLESELFGHERGAFTGAIARKVGRFERAHGGVLFLDEIGDLSLVLQAKILRALQERTIERLGSNETIPIDVRVVAATHRDLEALMATGDFREDLFYRLSVVRLHLPPLRERGADVEALASHFGARFAREHGRPARTISPAVRAALLSHPWPGNVRELRNVMERAVLRCSGSVLLPEHLELATRRPSGSSMSEGAEPLPGYSPRLSIDEVETLHIARVLSEVGGHFGRAAEILGIHRNTVSQKARQKGLA